MLVVVCGLPGVGKSTVAEFIVEETGARRLRTDIIRQEVIDDPEYTEPERRTVYEELYDRAATAIENGEDVVLDGTFWAAPLRERAADLAADFDTEFVLIEVTCSDDVVEQRIESRGQSVSDADVAVHDHFRDEFDPVDREHVTVDNSNGIDQTRRQIQQVF